MKPEPVCLSLKLNFDIFIFAVLMLITVEVAHPLMATQAWFCKAPAFQIDANRSFIAVIPTMKSTLQGRCQEPLQWPAKWGKLLVYSFSDPKFHTTSI